MHIFTNPVMIYYVVVLVLWQFYENFVYCTCNTCNTSQTCLGKTSDSYIATHVKLYPEDVWLLNVISSPAWEQICTLLVLQMLWVKQAMQCAMQCMLKICACGDWVWCLFYYYLANSFLILNYIYYYVDFIL